MLAQRLPGLLPPLSARELLEVSQIQSISGLLERGRLSRTRPFRAPHHSASMAALVGGGIKAKPGEVSLAHHGVLFLDELPEFPAHVLDSLRQPLEAGEAVVARANRHVRYPARFQLIAAMNPCRCGGGPGAAACTRGPKCAQQYQSRLSGPFLDRIDLYYDTRPSRLWISPCRRLRKAPPRHGPGSRRRGTSRLTGSGRSEMTHAAPSMPMHPWRNWSRSPGRMSLVLPCWPMPQGG